MDDIGSRLRALRRKWGLTLQEVSDRSARLAEKLGNPKMKISPSWLSRAENSEEEHDYSYYKMVALTNIYQLSADESMDLSSLWPKDAPSLLGAEARPNSTILLTSGGPLEKRARDILPDQILSEPTPDKTKFLSSLDFMPSNFRRGIIGNEDRCMFPLLKPGTIVLINIHKRTVAHRREWTGEYDRPVYFIETSKGFFCAWCSLDRDKTMLSIVPHYSSDMMPETFKYRLDANVVGKIVATFQRYEELAEGTRASA